MADTHQLRSPSFIPSPEFAELNLQAEARAKQCSPATLPSLDHLTLDDYDAVYEPSDDTFLLVDALSLEFPRAAPVRMTLEIGCGTGVATVYLANRLRRAGSICQSVSNVDASHQASTDGDSSKEKCAPNSSSALHYVTDVNERALNVSVRTALANSLPPHAIEPMHCDLATPFFPRLASSIDVLIFNPPYVPTPDGEVGSSGIEASWAGGKNGRRVLDRALPQIAGLLRWPAGAAYVVTVDDNKPEEIAEWMEREFGVEVKPFVRRRARNEWLTVLKMTPSRPLDLGSKC